MKLDRIIFPLWQLLPTLLLLAALTFAENDPPREVSKESRVIDKWKLFLRDHGTPTRIRRKRQLFDGFNFQFMDVFTRAMDRVDTMLRSTQNFDVFKCLERISCEMTAPLNEESGRQLRRDFTVEAADEDEPVEENQTVETQEPLTRESDASVNQATAASVNNNPQNLMPSVYHGNHMNGFPPVPWMPVPYSPFVYSHYPFQPMPFPYYTPYVLPGVLPGTHSPLAANLVLPETTVVKKPTPKVDKTSSDSTIVKTSSPVEVDTVDPTAETNFKSVATPRHRQPIEHDSINFVKKPSRSRDVQYIHVSRPNRNTKSIYPENLSHLPQPIHSNQPLAQPDKTASLNQRVAQPAQSPYSNQRVAQPAHSPYSNQGVVQPAQTASNQRVGQPPQSPYSNQRVAQPAHSPYSNQGEVQPAQTASNQRVAQPPQSPYSNQRVAQPAHSPYSNQRLVQPAQTASNHGAAQPSPHSYSNQGAVQPSQSPHYNTKTIQPDQATYPNQRAVQPDPSAYSNRRVLQSTHQTQTGHSFSAPSNLQLRNQDSSAPIRRTGVDGEEKDESTSWFSGYRALVRSARNSLRNMWRRSRTDSGRTDSYRRKRRSTMEDTVKIRVKRGITQMIKDFTNDEQIISRVSKGISEMISKASESGKDVFGALERMMSGASGSSIYPLTQAALMGYVGDEKTCSNRYPLCPTSSDQMVTTFNNLRKYFPDGLPFRDRIPRPFRYFLP